MKQLLSHSRLLGQWIQQMSGTFKHEQIEIFRILRLHNATQMESEEPPCWKWLVCQLSDRCPGKNRNVFFPTTLKWPWEHMTVWQPGRFLQCMNSLHQFLLSVPERALVDPLDNAPGWVNRTKTVDGIIPQIF